MKWTEEILFGLQTPFPTTAQREEATRQTGLTPRKVLKYVERSVA